MTKPNAVSLFAYMSPGNKETLLAGIVAWLLDKNGSHGLHDTFFQWVWDRVMDGREFPTEYNVKTEERADRSKRFDISIKDGGGRDASTLLILEVKAKTEGGQAQLERYSNQGSIKVARLAFSGEWNYPSIAKGSGADQTFPLVTFSEITKWLKEYSKKGAFAEFIEDCAEYLATESHFLAQFLTYYTEGGKVPPQCPFQQGFSAVFYQGVLLRCLKEKLRCSPELGFAPRDIKSENSGVWLSSEFLPKERLSFPTEAGGVKAFLMIELSSDPDWAANLVSGDSSSPVGELLLRVWYGDDPASSLDEARKHLLNDEDAYTKQEFRLKQYRKARYFITPFARTMTVADMSFPRLGEILSGLAKSQLASARST